MNRWPHCLREELKSRGFEECEGELVRTDGDLTTTSTRTVVRSRSIESAVKSN